MTLGSLSAGGEPHILGSVSRMQRETRAGMTVSAVAHLGKVPQTWLAHEKGGREGGLCGNNQNNKPVAPED